MTSTDDAGSGTLRQAILDAALNAEEDTIQFDSALAGSIISLTQSLKINNDDVTIDGSSTPGVTISGSQAGRVFFVEGGAKLELVELTVSDGDATNEAINRGGGIYNKGELFVTTCTVKGNKANIGGGIANEGGNVLITHSAILENEAATDSSGHPIFGVRGGGGVANESGLVVIDSSTLRENKAGLASNFSGDAMGGGILNIGTPGTVRIKNTTVSGNEAGDDAGGIYNQTGEILEIISSTITGNLAASAGGGIENFGSVNVQNTILAGNLAGQSTGETSHDCRSLSGTITSTGHNLVGQNCSPFTILSDLTLGQGVLSGKTINDIIDTTISNNGGSTFTHSLLTTSQAIDAGSCLGISGDATAVDQRSVDRPFDDPTVPNPSGGDSCDIGAFEFDTVTCVSKQRGKWKDPTIWSCGAKPTESVDAIVAPGHEVETEDDQKVKKLKVAGGKGRSKTGGGKLKAREKFLEVFEDLIIDGKFDPGTGKVGMKGNSKQKIKGKGDKKFYNLNINNQATIPDDSTDVETEGLVEVLEELEIQKGQFRPDTLSKFKDLLIFGAGKLKPKVKAILEIKGKMTKTEGGNFTHNESKLKFIGTGKQLLRGAFKLKDVEVDKTTANDEANDLEFDFSTEVEGETKIKKGQLTPNSQNKFNKLIIELLGKMKPKFQALLEVKGDMSKLGGGGYTHNDSKVKFTGFGKQIISGAFKFKDVVIDKNTIDDETKDLELGTGTEVEGETKVMKGKLAPASLTKFNKMTIEASGKLKPKLAALLELKGDLTKKAGGTFSHNNGKWRFTGKEKQKILGALKFRDIEIDKTTLDDENKDLELDPGTEVEGETKVRRGKLAPDNLTKFNKVTIEASGKLKPKLAALLELKGDLTKKAGGTFSHNNGKWKFTGKLKQKVVGALKFKDVEIDKSTTDDDVNDLDFDPDTEVEGEAKIMRGQLTPSNRNKFNKLTIETLGKLRQKLGEEMEVKGNFLKKLGGKYRGNQGLVKFNGVAGEQKAEFDGGTTSMNVLLTNLAGLRASHKEGTSGKTSLNICNSKVTLDSVLTGDKVLVKCGSITTEVVDGPIEIALGPQENIAVTVPSDTTATASEIAPGNFAIANAPGSSGSLSVAIDNVAVVIGPGETAEITGKGALQLLRTDVFELNLQKGIENSLVKKLDNALKKLDSGNINAAVNQVNAFVNQVQALSGKKLSAEAGSTLIANAKGVIILLTQS